MSRSVLALCLLTFVFAPFAQASFPSHVTVHFKNKMSCRDARKLLKPSRLYVNCQLNSMRTDEYSAEYLGQQPLTQVMAELATNAKVRGVASSDETPEEAASDNFRPVQGSLY